MTFTPRWETPLAPSKDQRIRSCKRCSAAIIWMKTMAGKNMPVDAATVVGLETTYDRSTHRSHFDTCGK